MSQSHLVIDFPIKGPASAKALPDESPPVGPRSRKSAGRTRHRAFLSVHGRRR